MPKGQDRVHLNDDNRSPGSDLTPKRISKEEFGRRLYRAMLGKALTESELARRANVLTDSVSNYVQGKTLPSHENLLRLAKTLGLKAEELLPNVIEGAIREDIPSIELKVSSGDPGKSWLKVNRLVRTGTAAKIITLLEADDVND
jgi:transcriptional regulator with XRE-family HTH domain